MNSRERNLLWLGGLVFALSFLPFVVVPAIQDGIQRQWNDLQIKKQKIDRLRDLRAATLEWRERHRNAKDALAQTENGLIQGETREAVTANMDKLTQKLVKQAGVRMVKREAPEAVPTEKWMQLTQVIEFEGDADQVMKLLTLLRDHPVSLPITKFEVNAHGQRLRGSAEVIGFSHRPPEAEEEADAAI